jgi:hypothetical protein
MPLIRGINAMPDLKTYLVALATGLLVGLI